MRRKRYITLSTEQDIELACVSMDRQARDTLQEFEHQIADRDDHERSLVLEARSGRLNDDWYCAREHLHALVANAHQTPTKMRHLADNSPRARR